jgi:hypothetical protein
VKEKIQTLQHGVHFAVFVRSTVDDIEDVHKDASQGLILEERMPVIISNSTQPDAKTSTEQS